MARIPSALTFLLVTGALLLVYPDIVNGDVSTLVSFNQIKFGTSWGAAPGVKIIKVEFWVTATTWLSAKDSLQTPTGTGLRKLSLSARNSSDASGAPDIEQSLSLEQSSSPLSGGKLHIKTEAILSGMGGCPEDKAHVCYILDKGDNPDPNFELAAPFRGCLIGKLNLSKQDCKE